MTLTNEITERETTLTEQAANDLDAEYHEQMDGFCQWVLSIIQFSDLREYMNEYSARRDKLGVSDAEVADYCRNYIEQKLGQAQLPPDQSIPF
jgi:hypothetical protein